MPNSIAAALTPDFLEKQVVVPLQSQLAPLNAFATQFVPDPIKPLASIQLKLVASGGTTQTDATDFRTGGDSVIMVTAASGPVYPVMMIVPLLVVKVN
jgi:hypothetical protein